MTLPSTRFPINPFANKKVPSDIKTLRRILRKELKTNMLYSTIWEEAKKTHKKKRVNFPNYFNSTTPDVCYIAITAYTIDFQVFVDGKPLRLFEDFHEKFRQLTDKASWKQFPYKSLYYLLTIAPSLVRQQPTWYHYLYRGLDWHIDPKPKRGETFYFDSFASSSTSRRIAEKFSDTNGTFITIVMTGPIVALGIELYSYFIENEVVVFPKNKFRVTDFHTNGKLHYLTLDVPYG